MTQQRSQHIGQATVINLVKTENNGPPPLPPRPAGALNTSFQGPPPIEPKPQKHIIKHASASLPRNHHQKKLKKLEISTINITEDTADKKVKRQSFHDVSNSTLAMFTKPVLKSLEDDIVEATPKVKLGFFKLFVFRLNAI